MNLSQRELTLRTTGLISHQSAKKSVFFRLYTLNYESDVACRVAQGNSIWECWVPVGCPLGGGECCGEELFSIENVNISPASISDLVSPRITWCLGSVIWYPSSFWERKTFSLDYLFQFQPFPNYLLSISPTRKQCRINRCSDVGLETGLQLQKRPHSETFHTWRILTLVWKLFLHPWKLCLILKNKLTLVVW